MSSTGPKTLPERPAILIILMGALGDVVRGLSVVDAIKSFRPGSRITWLVEPACAGIVRLHPLIDRVVVFNRKEWRKGFLSAFREIRSEKYDITLDMQRHSKSGLFSWVSRSPRRTGFHRRDSKEGNWLFNTEYVPYQGDDIPKAQHYLTFLDRVGIPRLVQHRSALQQITIGTLEPSYREMLPSQYVALVLGSSWESKDWPEEGYRQLISRLLELPTISVALLGDKTKAAMGERLALEANSARVVNLAGKTDLNSLVGVLNDASVVVGPDSGPGHISGSVGTPHITLFGPTPVKRNAPTGSEELTLSSNVGCAPCRRRVCPGLGGVCMKLITADAVMEKVRGVLGSGAGV